MSAETRLAAVVEYLRSELNEYVGERNVSIGTHRHVDPEQCVICTRLREALRLATEDDEGWPEPAPLPEDYWESAQ